MAALLGKFPLPSLGFIRFRDSAGPLDTRKTRISYFFFLSFSAKLCPPYDTSEDKIARSSSRLFLTAVSSSFRKFVRYVGLFPIVFPVEFAY